MCLEKKIKKILQITLRLVVDVVNVVDNDDNRIKTFFKEKKPTTYEKSLQIMKIHYENALCLMKIRFKSQKI